MFLTFFVFVTWRHKFEKLITCLCHQVTLLLIDKKDERKVERFKNRLTSLRDKFITIFDNAINDEKKAMSFFKEN